MRSLVAAIVVVLLAAPLGVRLVSAAASAGPQLASLEAGGALDAASPAGAREADGMRADALPPEDGAPVEAPAEQPPPGYEILHAHAIGPELPDLLARGGTCGGAGDQRLCPDDALRDVYRPPWARS